MAYYDALTAKWATAPAGTTDEKLAWINAEVVTGAVPATYYTSAADLHNCIDYAEFKALTAAQQTSILNNLQVQGSLLSGTANTTHMIPGLFLDLFPAGSKTRTAMVALAKALTMPWWQAPVDKGGGGLSSPVSQNDLTAAGLS